MRILLAADGSDYTRRALDYLAAHDWLRPGNSLCVFTVALRLPHRAAAFAGPDRVQDFYADDAQQVLRPLRERLAACRAAVDFDHVVGHPAEAIAHRAEQGRYDLIVMGSHGHGALAGLVLGSVATGVLARCSIPVLLIR